MKRVDEKLLERIKKRTDKHNKANTVPNLIRQCKVVLLNLYKFISTLKVLELSNILISLNGWQKSKGNSSKKNFKVRDIVEVDLGLGHGYEMSYRHPCIVLYNSDQGFCYIVPCSTGKYGKNNKFIIDGEVTDGFERPSGVLIDAVRCVSKTRITGKVGEITVPFLDKINNELISLYFSRFNHKLKVNQKDIEALQLENKQLKQKIIEYEKKIKSNVS